MRVFGPKRLHVTLRLESHRKKTKKWTNDYACTYFLVPSAFTQDSVSGATGEIN